MSFIYFCLHNQQYDSHVGRFRQVSLECFIVDCSTPCLRGVGVKARSGKEDTTLLSMVDRRVKQENVSTTMIWNKTPDSRVSKGERTHRGSKHPSTQKKKQKKKIPALFSYRVFDATTDLNCCSRHIYGHQRT